MIHLLNQLPKKFAVACSGGMDSMFALSFFIKGNHKPLVAYFNHGDNQSKEYDLIKSFCDKHNLSMLTEDLKEEKPKNESLEEHWRNQRYKFLESIQMPIITAHHLDDVVETWLFSSINGQPKLLPYRRNNVIRPFLITEKRQIVSWMLENDVKYVDDISNNDLTRNRNYIRKFIVPHVLQVNPGIHKTLKKMIGLKYKEA